MCRRVTCSQCGKPTYAGCGAHIEQVLADVPREGRCQCREQAAQKRQTEGQTGQQSWFSKLLGKQP